MKARKKPVIIEAFKWTGGPDQTEDPEWICAALQKPWGVGAVRILSEPTVMEIFTLEGIHQASLGDYIIQGVNGEIYPCKPDIFEKTYDIVKN